jgi:hypothetical protein
VAGYLVKIHRNRLPALNIHKNIMQIR